MSTLSAAALVQVPMGCDGGSIPSRADMVKVKTKEESVDDSDMVKALWTCCYISKQPLERPVVACSLGRLYNKESVVLFLLQRDSQDAALVSELSHIRSLKSVFGVTLANAKTDDSLYFVCPITGREMNGKSRFVVVKRCGCVLSEQALRQFPDTKTCLVCERPDFDAAVDTILLNGKREEMEKLREGLVNDKSPAGGSTHRKRQTVQTTEEVKPSGEIATLKRTRVTESLYAKTTSEPDRATSGDTFSCRTFNRYVS